MRVASAAHLAAVAALRQHRAHWIRSLTYTPWTLCVVLRCAGVTVDTSAFVFKGRVLGDNEPVSSILEAGGHVGVAQVGVVLEFDPSAKVRPAAASAMWRGCTRATSSDTR